MAINLLFILGRVYGGGGLSLLDAYQPSYRPAIYFERAFHFLSEALYSPGWFTPIVAVVLFALLAAMTIALIVTEVSRCHLPFRERQMAQFVAILLFLVSVNGKHGQIDFDGQFEQGRLIRTVYEEIRTMQPVIPRDSNILFLHDPFPEMNWATTFIVALHARDLSVRVFRLDHLPKDAMRDFNIVLSYEKKKLATCAIDWAVKGDTVASVCSYPQSAGAPLISSLKARRN